MTKKDPQPTPATGADFLSTGLTLLNLATYGRTQGGIRKGRIYGIIGRSSGGKTFLALTILAEAAANKNFDKHVLVYDGPERGDEMDKAKFFGKMLFARIKEDHRSANVAEFFAHVSACMDNGPVIYVIDSLDSLVGDAENRMSDTKAKAYSQGLRRLIDRLDATGSILILISQAKADIGSPIPTDTRSGGRSPEFYSTADFWLRKIKILTRAVGKKKVGVGIQVRAQVKKNRISGRDRTIFFPIYWDTGIDDTGACVDWLLEWGYWKKSGGLIDATKDLDMKAGREDLIQKIEEQNKQRQLQLLVAKVWKEIEDKVAIKRKSRYQ